MTNNKPPPTRTKVNPYDYVKEDEIPTQIITKFNNDMLIYDVTILIFGETGLEIHPLNPIVELRKKEKLIGVIVWHHKDKYRWGRKEKKV